MARVLVVDDVPESVRLIAMLLQTEGHEVLTVATPAQAFAVLKSKPIEVIIVDQNMPGMTGESLLARVAALWPATRPLMLTADPRIREEPGRRYPVMHKPFKIAELRAAVAALVAKPHP